MPHKIKPTTRDPGDAAVGKSFDQLIRDLTDANAQVGKAAALMLLRHPDARIGKAAARMLMQQTRKRAIGTASINDFERLIDALRGHSATAREAALQTLRNINERWLQSAGAEPQLGKFISALSSRNPGSWRGASDVLRMLRPEWGQGTAKDPRVGTLVSALQDASPLIRKCAADTLGRIGDAAALESLLHAGATSAVDAVFERNRAAIEAFPALLCADCALRAARHRCAVSMFGRRNCVVCRSCGSSLALRVGVETVIGFVGGPGLDFLAFGNAAEARLWFEDESRARNADIDTLVIRAGGVRDFERALNSVLNVLRNDISRPVNALKGIPVQVEPEVALAAGVRRMLADTFGPVHQ